jgi:hypothetical protein
MIALVKLDRRRHCLDRLAAGGGPYVCRRAAGHRGPHDYLPIDMVIIAAPPTPRAEPLPLKPAPRRG